MKKEESIPQRMKQFNKIQESERKKIFHELHEHVAQDLGALEIYCELILNAPTELSGEVRQNIKNMSYILSDTIERVRELSYDLCPSDPDNKNLEGAISEFCEEYSQKNWKNVQFSSNGINNLKLDTDTKIHICQILEEWLKNIQNDADVTRVTIRLVKVFSEIYLRIEDNGKGFDTKQGLAQSKQKSLTALQKIEKTVSRLNGQMKSYFRTEFGTIISIKFPYQVTSSLEIGQ